MKPRRASAAPSAARKLRRSASRSVSWPAALRWRRADLRHDRGARPGRVGLDGARRSIGAMLHVPGERRSRTDLPPPIWKILAPVPAAPERDPPTDGGDGRPPTRPGAHHHPAPGPTSDDRRRHADHGPGDPRCSTSRTTSTRSDSERLIDAARRMRLVDRSAATTAPWSNWPTHGRPASSSSQLISCGRRYRPPTATRSTLPGARWPRSAPGRRAPGRSRGRWTGRDGSTSSTAHSRSSPRSTAHVPPEHRRPSPTTEARRKPLRGRRVHDRRRSGAPSRLAPAARSSSSAADERLGREAMRRSSAWTATRTCQFSVSIMAAT